MKLTIVGARGFIGSAIAALARARGLDVVAASHDKIPTGSLGTVVYCSGLAWGSDERPLEAYRLHVCAALELLMSANFERLLYVSSTRVYDGLSSTNEDAQLAAFPSDRNATYATSKIAGEAAVLAASERNIVVRLSNVYGPNFRARVFLSDILRQAIETGRIELRTALASSKDYISVDEVADLVLRIMGEGKHQIYNVAAGRNTTNAELTRAIAATLPVEVRVASNAPTSIVPKINIQRIRDEFGFSPRDVLDEVPVLVRAFSAAIRGSKKGERT